MYAITVHKSQSITIDRPFSINEYDKMEKDMLYTAITRTREQGYINFCNIKIYKNKIGYIYKLSYKGLDFYGSTDNVERRMNEHMTDGKGKLGSLISEVGFDALTLSIVKQVNYAVDVELFEIENKYIEKYNTVRNGLNNRRNYKNYEME